MLRISIRYLFLVLVLVCCDIATAAPSHTVRLKNAAQEGVDMPVVGLGTGAYGTIDGNDGEHWNDSVSYAAAKSWIALGGRRIDTSFGYWTQKGIGQAWKESGISRSEFFFTSKVDLSGYDAALDQFKQTLKNLQTDYVDLMLIHWPGEQRPSANNLTCKQGEPTYKKCRQESWRALQDIFRDKGARAIGVSNFQVTHLLNLAEMKAQIPSVNQVEFHVYWHEDDLVDYCHKNGIAFNSYAPLGAPDHMAFHQDRWGPPLLTLPRIKTIAEVHNKTTAQVMLRWALQQDIVVNPRTLNPTHMKENLNIFDFELTHDEVARISFIQHPTMYKVCEDSRLMP